MNRRPDNAREGGFALMMALWMVVMIGVLALSFGMRVREQRLMAINMIDHSRALGAARAGIQETEARLDELLAGDRILGARSSPGSWDDPWANASLLMPDTGALGPEGERSKYRVLIRDAGERLNVNRCSEDQLRRLLISLRVDAGEADRIAQAVADWKDADDLRRARGAEREEYIRSGSAARPANGPFGNIGELRDVFGMSPGVFEKVRPFVTVSGSGHVNVNRAPREVLLSLPGMSGPAVAVLLGHRHSIRSLTDLLNAMPDESRQQLVDALPELSTMVSFETREVAVDVEGWSDGSRVHVWVEALMSRPGWTTVVEWERVQ